MEQTKPKHWTAEEILAAATPIGDGYSQIEIVLYEGDTAWHPASTKKVLRGYGRIDYLIHASGVHATWDGSIRESYVAAA